MPCGCCLVASVGALIPRVVLAFLWIFTDVVSRAFDGWIAPLAGLLILPYTTLVYVALYAPGKGVSTSGWFLVILGLFFDLAHYTGGIAGRGRRVNDFYSRGAY